MSSLVAFQGFCWCLSLVGLEFGGAASSEVLPGLPCSDHCLGSWAVCAGLGSGRSGLQGVPQEAALPATWEGLQSSSASLVFLGPASNRPLHSVHAYGELQAYHKIWSGIHKAFTWCLQMTSLNQLAKWMQQAAFIFPIPAGGILGLAIPSMPSQRSTYFCRCLLWTDWWSSNGIPFFLVVANFYMKTSELLALPKISSCPAHYFHYADETFVVWLYGRLVEWFPHSSEHHTS